MVQLKEFLKSQEIEVDNVKQTNSNIEEEYRREELEFEFIRKNVELKIQLQNAENENIIQGQHVDAYTFSTEDLMRAYENAQVSQEDLNNAFETLNRTKAEREQTHNQAKNNSFEGR